MLYNNRYKLRTMCRKCGLNFSTGGMYIQLEFNFFTQKLPAMLSMFYSACTTTNLPRLDIARSSNLLNERSSDVNLEFISTALHTLERPSESSLQCLKSSDVRTLFTLNIVPVYNEVCVCM